MTEKNFPLPVKKNKFGQDVSKLTAGDYYRQLVEKMLEAYKASVIHDVNKVLVRDGCGLCWTEIEDQIGIDDEAEKLADIMSWCVTRLEQIDYNEEERQVIYRVVNARNRKLGYFGDDVNA